MKTIKKSFSTKLFFIFYNTDSFLRQGIEDDCAYKGYPDDNALPKPVSDRTQQIQPKIAKPAFGAVPCPSPIEYQSGKVHQKHRNNQQIAAFRMDTDIFNGFPETCLYVIEQAIQYFRPLSVLSENRGRHRVLQCIRCLCETGTTVPTLLLSG